MGLREGGPSLWNHHQLEWLSWGWGFHSRDGSLVCLASCCWLLAGSSAGLRSEGLGSFLHRPLNGPTPRLLGFLHSLVAGLPAALPSLHAASRSPCSVSGISHRVLSTFKEREHRPQFMMGEVSTSHCKKSRWDGRCCRGHFWKMQPANKAVRGNARERRDYTMYSHALVSES